MSHLATLTDQALLDRFARQGDEQAFAAIVQRYTDSVYATCLRILQNRAQAQDAAQETFFRLVRNPSAVEQSLGGWLHRVATTQSIDAMRRERSRRDRERMHAQERPAVVQASTWQELSPHLDAALADLPDQQRWLLVQHYLCGRSLGSLTAEAGVSTPTLSRRHHTALDALRRQLRKRGVVAGAAALTTLLTHHTAHAAPPALAFELSRMTLLSAAANTGVGGGKAAMALAAAVFAMMLTAVATAMVLAWPGPASSHSPNPEAAAPVAAPAAVHSQSVQVRYVALPQASVGLEPTRIALVQDPRSSADGFLAVVYQDNHTETVPIEVARERVLRQTGQSLDDLAARAATK